MFLDFLLIFILILANGFFASAEIAVVSARETRLQTRSNAGDARAAKVLHLQRKPGEFLATVQIGITLVGTLASAVGGVEAVRWLGPQLSKIPALVPYADQAALAIVVITLSYASLLLGELVPKRLAIRNPERWAMSVAGFFENLSRLAAWPVRFLLVSANLLMGPFGNPTPDDETTSSEEIELLVRRGTVQGVFQPVQESMITRVIDYVDRATRDVMTPRTEIIALEAETPSEVALQNAKHSGFSRFPVYQENIDQILGYVHVKDLIWAAPETPLKKIARQVVFIPEGGTLPQAFTLLTRSSRHMGIVLDEFGGTGGLITLEDLLEEIVGEIEDEHSPVAEVPIREQQGQWYISGGTSIADIGNLLGISFKPEGVYVTLAGFIMTELGRIPDEGDQLIKFGYTFTVNTKDRLRIVDVHIIKKTSENADG